MANKYSKYQLQPYVSQYVDPQRTQIAELLRGRYEKNLSGHSAISNTASSIKVGAGDQQIKDDAIQNITGQFQDIVTNNNYEDAGRVVQNAKTELMSNEGLVTASQSYANWENEEKTAAQIRMTTGKNVLFNKEYARDENGAIVRDEKGIPQIVNKFDKHQSYYQDERTGEMVKNVYQSTGQAQLQYADKMKEIIENIAGDPVALQRLANNAGFENPSNLYGYLVHGQEVSDEKAVRLAKELSDLYINSSDEGVQHMAKLTSAVGGENLNPATGDHWTAEEAEALIQDQMIAIARQQVGSDLSYMTDAAFIAANKAKDNAPLTAKLQTFNSDATMNSQVVTGLDFIDLDDDFDANGKIVQSSTVPKGITRLHGNELRGRQKQHLKVTADSFDGNWARRYKLAGMEQNQLESGYFESLLDAAGVKYKKESWDASNHKNVEKILLYHSALMFKAKKHGLFEQVRASKGREPANLSKGEMPNTLNMYQVIYGGGDPGPGEQAQKEHKEVLDRQRVRLQREFETAKAEGRPPRLSILGANKLLYMEAMREQYPEVSAASKTDKEFFKNMASIQEKYEVASTKIYRPTNKYIDGFREMILSTPTDWIIRRDDGSFTNSIEDVQIQLGYKDKKGNWESDGQVNWIDMMGAVTGAGAEIQGLMTGGQKPGSFAINLRDMDGKNYTVELANSNEAQQQFRGPHEIISDLQSGRAQDYRTSETAKIIQSGQVMLSNGTIADAELKVHYEINTKTMEWEPVVTQYYYEEGTKTNALEPEELRRQGAGVIDYLMEMAVAAYMSTTHMIGTDMNVGKAADLSNPK